MTLFYFDFLSGCYNIMCKAYEPQAIVCICLMIEVVLVLMFLFSIFPTLSRLMLEVGGFSGTGIVCSIPICLFYIYNSIVTMGEGRFDPQTSPLKTPGGITELVELQGSWQHSPFPFYSSDEFQDLRWLIDRRYQETGVNQLIFYDFIICRYRCISIYSSY